MNNFNNAIIYKLISDENPNLIYYGATTTSLQERYRKHKYNSTKCTSYLLFELGNVRIYPVEYVRYKTKKFLNKRESYYIRNFECVNRNVPDRSKKEYMAEKYYPERREQLLKPLLCECGRFTSKAHIRRHERSIYHQNYLNSLLFIKA